MTSRHESRGKSGRPRRRTRLPKVGDVLQIPLSNGRFAYAHYVHFDPGEGPFVQVFDYVTDAPATVAELEGKPALMQPIRCGINPPVREGRWTIIGALPPPERFTVPTGVVMFRDPSGAPLWFLVRSFHDQEFLGHELPEEYSHLETAGVVNDLGLESRILSRLGQTE